MAEDKQAIYERAEMDNQTGYGDRPALLVVDLQTGFTDPENPLGGDLTAVVERTNTLVEAAHEGEIPVVFTRIVTKHEDARDLGVWGEKIPSLSTLQADSEWVDIDPRLHVDEGDHVLDKRQASAYHETELDSMLTALGVDTVVVTGCTTSGCIRATAVDACSHGYYTVVPESAVGDRAMEPHEANLFDINAKYGDVRPVEEAAEYLADGS
ncbi:isochorismatase family protein [Halorientalis pallida]|uniref:Isochorismatase family protein n=1 Tax=Halorientalis pallida TaxID=2479928 RepID=A0A498KT00_9EURY|nr:isochorismatase family protein [Halorientalis pallida]RXK47907.1 isochorismatase family protein [Halorientalis pallida]